MQSSFCFYKTYICLKHLKNIQISVNMIDRLDITNEYSLKCDFILNTVIFVDAALNILWRKVWKCNVLWFYLFGQGVPNETKGMINLNWHKEFACKKIVKCCIFREYATKCKILKIPTKFLYQIWQPPPPQKKKKKIATQIAYPKKYLE